mmetsp:Transcript_29055/g.85985  ORF Transcript_29055/g.85985 Transcript_29055/m.85985 type:complete len:447 (+) Transcript_29055:247-1587(+)
MRRLLRPALAVLHLFLLLRRRRPPRRRRIIASDDSLLLPLEPRRRLRRSCDDEGERRRGARRRRLRPPSNPDRIRLGRPRRHSRPDRRSRLVPRGRDGRNRLLRQRLSGFLVRQPVLSRRSPGQVVRGCIAPASGGDPHGRGIDLDSQIGHCVLGRIGNRTGRRRIPHRAAGIRQIGTGGRTRRSAGRPEGLDTGERRRNERRAYQRRGRGRHGIPIGAGRRSGGRGRRSAADLSRSRRLSCAAEIAVDRGGRRRGDDADRAGGRYDPTKLGRVRQIRRGDNVAGRSEAHRLAVDPPPTVPPSRDDRRSARNILPRHGARYRGGLRRIVDPDRREGHAGTRQRRRVVLRIGQAAVRTIPSRVRRGAGGDVRRGASKIDRPSRAGVRVAGIDEEGHTSECDAAVRRYSRIDQRIGDAAMNKRIQGEKAYALRWLLRRSVRRVYVLYR